MAKAPMDLSSLPESQEHIDDEKYVQLDDDDTSAVKKDVKNSFNGDKLADVPHTVVGKGVEYAISTKPGDDHIEKDECLYCWQGISFTYIQLLMAGMAACPLKGCGCLADTSANPLVTAPQLAHI